MTNIDVESEVYGNWVKFYKKHSKMEYPTLKNFTAKKLNELMNIG